MYIGRDRRKVYVVRFGYVKVCLIANKAWYAKHTQVLEPQRDLNLRSAELWGIADRKFTPCDFGSKKD